MATKGIKRIRINKTGKEGTNNIIGLRNLSELNISHPQGINPQVDASNTTDPGTLGGRVTYVIPDKSKISNDEFLFTTETQDIDIYQNIYQDIYASQSLSGGVGTGQIVRTLYTKLDANINSLGAVQDIQYAYLGNTSRLTFGGDTKGNVAGWWSNGVFQIKDLPNTAFKFSGRLTFRGGASPPTERIWLTLADSGIKDVYGFTYQNDGVFSDTKKRYMGYLPPIYMDVSASTTNGLQTWDFEFMVTQSYSKVLDVPIGPSVTKKRYYDDGTTSETTDTYQQWQLYIGSDREAISGFSNYSIDGANTSWVQVEPIQIVGTTEMPWGLPRTTGGTAGQLTGSIVQPPTKVFTDFDQDQIVEELPVGTILSASQAFFYSGFKYISLWDNYVVPGSSNLYQQVIAGRLSFVELTGSLTGTTQDIWRNYAGWRYTSLTQTSSLVPIDNTNINFAISDFNPKINNAINGRPSTIYCDVDYTRGTVQPLNRSQILNKTATRAIVEDSNYSKKSWSNLRYNGSRVSSNNVNKK